MKLNHRFSVPADLATVWEVFTTPELLAACFPGASIDQVNGDHFSGSLTLKFGSVISTYDGVGTIVPGSGRLVIKAEGTDRRGFGTLSATVTADLVDRGETTDVSVRTDLVVSEKSDTLGPELIQQASARLVDQFAARVAEGPGRGNRGYAAGEGGAPRTDSTSAPPRGHPKPFSLKRDAPMLAVAAVLAAVRRARRRST